MMSIRGWGTADDAGHDEYQAPCGHYIKSGTYECRECNIAPLSRVRELERQLAKLQVRD